MTKISELFAGAAEYFSAWAFVRKNKKNFFHSIFFSKERLLGGTKINLKNIESE